MKLKIVGEIMTVNENSLEYVKFKAQAEMEAAEARERIEIARDYADWKETVRRRIPERAQYFRSMSGDDGAVAVELLMADAPGQTTEERQRHLDAANARLGMQLLGLTDDVYLYPILPFSGIIRDYNPLRKRYVLLKPRTVEPTEESVIGPLDEATLKKLADYITYPVAEVLEK